MFDDYENEKGVNGEILFKVTEPYFTDLMHKTIGALIFRDRYNRFITGSATLISKDVILTAAHNIYDKKFSYEYSQFKFYPAARGVISEGYEIEGWRYMAEFRTCPEDNRIQYDFAIMKLRPNPELVTQTDYLKLQCLSSSVKKQNFPILSIFGYPIRPPGHLPNYVPKDPQFRMLEVNQFGLTCERRVVEINHSYCKISYSMNTYKGQSGCPVVANGRIIAVHTGAGKQDQKFNVGCIITRQIVAIANLWVSQLRGSPFTIYEPQCLLQIISEEHRQLQNLQFRYSQIKDLSVSQLLARAFPFPSYYFSLIYKQILLLPHQKIQEIELEIEQNHNILKVVPNSIRLYFYKVIFNQYKDRNLRQFFNLPNIPDERTSQRDYTQFIIRLYDHPNHGYYQKINKYLRSCQQSFAQENGQILKLIVELVKTHQFLTISRYSRVYRGVSYVLPQNTTGAIQFSNFASTSANRTIAELFARQRGTLFEIKSITGRSTQPYATILEEEEVLILPFTYFSIQSRTYEMAILAELPGPLTYSKNIIIWVHDNPQTITHEAWKKQFNIEILCLLTTRLFMEWFKVYGWLLSWDGIKVRVVTSMRRAEEEGLNQEAGLTLLHYLCDVENCQNQVLVIECNQSEQYELRANQLGIEGNWRFTNSPQAIRQFVSFN